MASVVEHALARFSRLTIGLAKQQCSRCFNTQAGPLAFRATQILWAEPMKKKRKLDPMMTIEKENKKRRKLEKAMRQLNKRGRILKPVHEIEGDRAVLKTKEMRRRDKPALSYEECESRALLEKEWSSYKYQQYNNEQKAILSMMKSQKNALLKLREESEELYQLAIQPDEKLIPFHCKGPLNSPPIKDYHGVDGDYTDTTIVYNK